ncbi:hypothetical protein M1N22_03820 [Dehalococcoidia bacterium]|nr:hypothetical protein [Dehalococcoidia bacterium]
MAEIQIDLKLTVKVAQEGMKINNLLYQLRKFMPHRDHRSSSLSPSYDRDW